MSTSDSPGHAAPDLYAVQVAAGLLWWALVGGGLMVLTDVVIGRWVFWTAFALGVVAALSLRAAGDLLRILRHPDNHTPDLVTGDGEEDPQ